MRVRNKDGVQRARIKRRLLPVAFAQFLQTLKQPAVNQHTTVARFHQILRSGDRTHTTPETDACQLNPPVTGLSRQSDNLLRRVLHSRSHREVHSRLANHTLTFFHVRAFEPDNYRNFDLQVPRRLDNTTRHHVATHDPAEDIDQNRFDILVSQQDPKRGLEDRKSTRLNSSHSQISYAVFCLKKKNKKR